MGKKPKLIVKRLTSVYLTDKQFEFVKKMGRGYQSKGMRAVVKYAIKNKMKPMERAPEDE